MLRHGPHEAATIREELLAELHAMEWRATVPSLCEAIRLLASEKYECLTHQQIQEVANYRPIEVEDEVFFDRAFSPGKEAAASLGFARFLGRDVVLDDLQRLHATLCAC
jgi:hypothetical protein